MGMMASFTYTLHVPMVTKVEHMMAVLYDTDVFTKRELIELARDLRETKYAHLKHDIRFGTI